MLTIPLFDEAGRLVVEPREVPDLRPSGIWDLNVDARPLATVCAWCPDSFERTQALKLAGFAVSHSLCSACAEKLHAELDAREGEAS